MPSAAMACPSSGVDSETQSANGSTGEVGSLEHLRSSEAFPKYILFECIAERLGSTESESETLSVPFPLLPGECVIKWGRGSGEVSLFLTNYRFFALLSPQTDTPPAFHDLPLPNIESVEMRELFNLFLATKDGKLVRLGCRNNEDCLGWFKVLTATALGTEKREKVFAFAFRAWCLDETRNQVSGVVTEELSHQLSRDSTRREFERLQLDPKYWRISADVNDRFDLCSSYPEDWILPQGVSDEEVRRGAAHRWLKRAPALVWRHRGNGSVLLRSSQPAPGLFSWRNTEDEKLLYAFATAAAEGREETPPLLILDARSYAAAWANRAKGGGFESPEYYQKCQVQFMGLANIHAIRNSFALLRTLLGTPDTDDGATWLQTLQGCGWLQHLSLLLSASLRAAEALQDEARSVLVHCSDGWDRTPQILSLTRLILDPDARTAAGFRSLVERDWVEFGHKFSDRLGLLSSGSPSERSPVFLQFLDAVHQLMRQYPLAFQFNQTYLVKLAQHCYSGLFGTFLCNSTSEVVRERVRERTFSVWAFLDGAQFKNPLYESRPAPLWPQTQVGQLALWRLLYSPEDPAAPRPRSPLPLPLQRTLSCDSLDTLTLPLTRTASHASITTPDLGTSTPVPEPDMAAPNGSNGHQQSPESSPEPITMSRLMAEEEERRESFTEDPLWAEPKPSSSPPSHVSTSTSDISDSLVRRDSVAVKKRERRRRKQGKELADWLDMDGLPTVRDPVQDRVRQLNAQYQRRLALMESELQRLRVQLKESNGRCPSNGHAHSPTPTEYHSINGRGRKESSGSWLEVDEDFEDSEGWGDDWEGLSDSGATKWVPDHAVSHCMGCDTAFWTINRRHHCRSCGKVFCSRCSQTSCPVPREALFQAVRVCKICFGKLNQQNGEESPISACA